MSEEQKPENAQPIPPTPGVIQVAIVLFGITLPILCHILTLLGPPEGPSWQSNELADKWAFILSGGCGWPVFPSLIYAIVCLTMMVRDESWAVTQWWVRFGIRTGVMVAAWYAIVFTITVNSSNPYIFAIVGFATIFLIWVVYRIIRLVKDRFNLSINQICGGCFVVVLSGLVLSLFANGPSGIPLFFVIPIIASLYFSTYWAFVVYLGVSIRIAIHYPQYRFSLGELILWMTWLSSFIAACRWSVVLSLAEYSKLPIENPGDCYVATAASNGCPTIVGSREIKDRAEKVSSSTTSFPDSKLQRFA